MKIKVYLRAAAESRRVQDLVLALAYTVLTIGTAVLFYFAAPHIILLLDKWISAISCPPNPVGWGCAVP